MATTPPKAITPYIATLVASALLTELVETPSPALFDFMTPEIFTLESLATAIVGALVGIRVFGDRSLLTTKGALRVLNTGTFTGTFTFTGIGARARAAGMEGLIVTKSTNEELLPFPLLFLTFLGWGGWLEVHPAPR